MSSTLQDARPTYGETRTKEEKLYDEEVMERVKRGMALLEEKYGPDWVDHIDLGTLGLASTTHCVLGQLYGDYKLGKSKLGISGHSGYGWGFCCKGLNVLREYRALDAAWRDALTPRVTTNV